MKQIFVPWENMPGTMKDYVSNNIQETHLQECVSMDRLFEIILQTSSSVRLPMLVANLANFVEFFVPQEDKEEFFDKLSSTPFLDT